MWKERNKRAFEGVGDEFERIRDRWLHTIGFLVIGDTLYSMEGLGNFIDILIDI